MFASFPFSPRHLLLLSGLGAFVFSSEPAAAKEQVKALAESEVVYAVDKEGNKQTGKLTLQLKKGKAVEFMGDPHLKGIFTLTLAKKDGSRQVTELNPLCKPLTYGDPLSLPAGPWKFVISDFNRDGVSELNLSQPGNSWGNHYMLFTFSSDGKGMVEAMLVDEDPDHNYLHPQSMMPSTDAIRATKEGFCYGFTERGNIQDREVDIHYRWNKHKKRFEESHRVAHEEEEDHE